jgi:hypothetical protein
MNRPIPLVRCNRYTRACNAFCLTSRKTWHKPNLNYDNLPCHSQPDWCRHKQRQVRCVRAKA